MIKAKAVKNYLKSKNLNYNVFADDSGLCVEALNGEPGVLSARYAGVHGNNSTNRKLLLDNLKDKNNRQAHFCLYFVLYR